MIYNALKMFMEISPELFDECSTQYRLVQEQAEEQKLQREEIWKRLEEKGRRASKQTTEEKHEPTSHESEERMKALRIEEDHMDTHQENGQSEDLPPAP